MCSGKERRHRGRGRKREIDGGRKGDRVRQTDGEREGESEIDRRMKGEREGKAERGYKQYHVTLADDTILRFGVETQLSVHDEKKE